MAAASYFNETFVFLREFHITTSGQTKSDLIGVAVNVRGRIDPLGTGRLAETVLGSFPSATHRGSVVPKVDVEPNDILERTSGERFIVLDVARAGSPLRTDHLQLVLKKQASK